jgi:hypothetical protein
MNTRLVPTCIINTTVLTLSIRHLAAHKVSYTCREIQYTLLAKMNFTCGNRFEEVVVEMYLSHYLKMAVLRAKHVGVTQC